MEAENLIAPASGAGTLAKGGRSWADIYVFCIFTRIDTATCGNFPSKKPFSRKIKRKLLDLIVNLAL